MTTRDQASDKKVVQHISAAVVSATQTPTNGVDTKGFDAVTFLISIGAITNIANSPQPGWTFHVEESDTINANFVAITDADRILVNGIKSPGTTPDSSTGVFLTIDAASEDDNVYHVGVISSKRYQRLVGTAVNSPGNTPLSVVAILEDGALVPVSN